MITASRMCQFIPQYDTASISYADAFHIGLAEGDMASATRSLFVIEDIMNRESTGGDADKGVAFREV